MPSMVRFPRISISIEREEIPVDTLSPSLIPDERWKYIDLHGHGHFWEGENLPTLEWVVTGTRWVGDEYDSEEVEIGEYRCLLCDEVVEPRKRPDYGPRVIPGLAWFTVKIDEEEFRLTEEQYARSVDEWLALLRAVK